MLAATAWILCLSAAQAGQLTVDSRVPVEVHVDLLPVLRLYGPGVATVTVPAGVHTLSVYKGATPELIVATFPEERTLQLLVGPSSLSLVDEPGAAPEAGELPPPLVELRVPPGPGALVHVGGQRIPLQPGVPVFLADLAPGTTPFEVRSVDGSLIWARGELELIAGDSLVLVLPEGRPIEVFGRAEAWVPGG